MKLRTKWLISGALGAFLFGSGLSITIECSHIKHSDGAFWIWVLGGTAGIGIALSGVVVLIRTALLEERMRKQKKQE